MKLSVHLVTRNGVCYVPFLFDSLRRQSYNDWELIIIDNQSTDGMAQEIRHQLINFPVPSRLIINDKNTGFAPAHNQAFKISNGEYVLLINQDMCLASDCFKKMVEYLDANKNYAAVSPRLMRWNFKGQNLDKFIRDSNRFQKSLTKQIDALGLKIFRSRRVIEQYTQQDWDKVKAIFAKGNQLVLEVFGVSGAFPMYRRSALSEVAFADGTFLDESYFMYKEDVDLAFRLKSAGYKAAVLLDIYAFHDRTGAGPKENSDWATLKNKQEHSKVVRYHSYKNHLATLYKNEYWQNFILDFPYVLWYELKKFIYFLIFDLSVLSGFFEIWKNRRELNTKRLNIKEKRKVNWREIRRWF